MESVVEGFNGGGGGGGYDDDKRRRPADVDADGCNAEKSTQMEADECDHNGHAEVTHKPLSQLVKRKRTKRLHLSDAGHRRRLMRLLVNSVRLQSGRLLASYCARCWRGRIRVLNAEIKKYWVKS